MKYLALFLFHLKRRICVCWFFFFDGGRSKEFAPQAKCPPTLSAFCENLHNLGPLLAAHSSKKAAEGLPWGLLVCFQPSMSIVASLALPVWCRNVEFGASSYSTTGGAWRAVQVDVDDLNPSVLFDLISTAWSNKAHCEWRRVEKVLCHNILQCKGYKWLDTVLRLDSDLEEVLNT